MCVCVFGAMWKMGKGTPGNKWTKTSSDSLLPVFHNSPYIDP